MYRFCAYKEVILVRPEILHTIEMANTHSCFIEIHIVIFVLIANSCCNCYTATATSFGGYSPPSLIPIALILDTNSPFGSMLHSCMQMAASEFYAAHSNYTTMLHLLTTNASTLLDTNLAGISLLLSLNLHISSFLAAYGYKM